MTAAKVKGCPSPDKLQERVPRVLEDKKFFRTCKDCQERNPVGWMCMDKGVCHECAEKNHGVVF